MNQSDDLFKLIRSLSKGEKKFFKLLASTTKGEKDYIRLFDAVDRQKKYDEKRIKQRYPDHFAVKKIYLQKQILRSLRISQAAGSAEAEVNGMLQEIEALADKRLFDQALAVIERAKKAAIGRELFPQLLSLGKWEYKCYHREGNQEKLDQYTGTLYTEELLWTERHRNLLEYRKLQSQLYSIYQYEGIVNKRAHLKALARFLKRPLLRSVSCAKSFSAKCIFYELRGTLYLQRKDYQRSINELKKWAALFKTDPAKIPEAPQSYFAVLANLSSRQIIVGAYADALKTVDEFEYLTVLRKKIPEHLAIDGQSIAFERKLLIYISTLQFDKAAALDREIERFNKQYGMKLRKNFILFYQFFMAYCYFVLHDLRRAGKLLNPLLALRTTVRKDLVISAHLLNLALHYEKGNLVGLPHVVRSSKRFIMANGNYASAIAVCDFFQALATGKYGFGSPLDKLKKKLKDLSSDPAGQMLMGNFEIIEWAESKKKRKSFAEMLGNTRNAPAHRLS